MQLGCWRSATSGRCRDCADFELGPAVRIRFPPAVSPVRTTRQRSSCKQLDRAGWESVNHFSPNPNDGTGLP
jgi:hypothetical protein